MKKSTISMIVVAAFGLIAFSMLFIVEQTQQGIVLQFGEPKRTLREPGLNWKLPFIQDVVFYENRVISTISSDSEEVILADQKRLEVDTYARYRIVDPLLFYQTVRNVRGAEQRLDAMIDSSVRRVLGGTTLVDLLSSARSAIIRDISSEVNRSAKSLGLEIVDVRIRRADYPDATSQNIFNRMKSEREREAKEFRATGEEEAQKIRADADKTVTVMLAEARRESEILRGQGDALSIKIYADAFGQDEEFFAFYRSMQAYRKTFTDDGTSLVISPDSEFFRYFGYKSGEKGE
ncbi:MAG: HflC protein [SAR116 cluster bacterium MED-G04]|jgi:membrane protease subunit HflC|nr:MAG: HflC protein [SAR116 cluster bacterium MED-G04]CAI8325531.1 MAG: Modulator of FtsH protease HflC [SAR116 cluster bacterium MED-G04]HCD50667.1 protease modulator HflC [Alphaproteobacteria bacterium]HCV61889.1 protease modulator HflC [Alphaproteobacteria bacterium]|tara:strand:- start:7819 stop:8694 length:876 start_codon:yes stop_codon:yes gene_type:complete